jgi:hypothetical protein
MTTKKIKPAKGYYWLVTKNWLRHPILQLRYHRRQKTLSKELGREANFGDMWADALGYRVEDPVFQSAIREAIGEVADEEW